MHYEFQTFIVKDFISWVLKKGITVVAHTYTHHKRWKFNASVSVIIIIQGSFQFSQVNICTCNSAMGEINGTLQSCTWFTVYGDVLLVISPMLAAFIAIILMYF